MSFHLSSTTLLSTESLASGSQNLWRTDSETKMFGGVTVFINGYICESGSQGPMEKTVLEFVEVRLRMQTQPLQNLRAATAWAGTKCPKCFTAQTRVFSSQLFQIQDYLFDNIKQSPHWLDWGWELDRTLRKLQWGQRFVLSLHDTCAVARSRSGMPAAIIWGAATRSCEEVGINLRLFSWPKQRAERQERQGFNSYTYLWAYHTFCNPFLGANVDVVWHLEKCASWLSSARHCLPCPARCQEEDEDAAAVPPRWLPARLREAAFQGRTVPAVLPKS